MKKWKILVIGLVGIGLICFSGFWRVLYQGNKERTPQHFKYRTGSYFFSVPICGDDPQNHPLIPVEVEGLEVLLLLDLGCPCVTLPSELVERLHKKTYVCTDKGYGLRGQEYEEKMYDLPEISMGDVYFSKLTIREQSKEFIKDSTIIPGPPTLEAAGLLGWKTFKTANLLLDVKNQQIAFCDSLTTLKEHGYVMDHAIKTPLFLDNEMIEVVVTTPLGCLRCILDTGATHNMLNTSGTFEEFQAQEKRWYHMNCSINDQDIGRLSFLSVPIRLPFPVDAILGMDFFKDHLVFLDFDENCAYILHNSKRQTQMVRL